MQLFLFQNIIIVIATAEFQFRPMKTRRNLMWRKLTPRTLDQESRNVSEKTTKMTTKVIIWSRFSGQVNIQNLNQNLLLNFSIQIQNKLTVKHFQQPKFPQENSASNVRLKKFSSPSAVLTVSLLKLPSLPPVMTSQSQSRSTNWRLSSARNITSFYLVDLIRSSVKLSARKTLQSNMFATWSSRLSWEVAVLTFRKTMASRWNATWLTFGAQSALSRARTTEFWRIESRLCATIIFNGKASSRIA